MTCVAFITTDAAHNHALVGWCLRWSARRPGRWHRVETRTGRNGARAGIALFEVHQ